MKWSTLEHINKWNDLLWSTFVSSFHISVITAIHNKSLLSSSLLLYWSVFLNNFSVYWKTVFTFYSSLKFLSRFLLLNCFVYVILFAKHLTFHIVNIIHIHCNYYIFTCVLSCVFKQRLKLFWHFAHI